jgi:hypothetical protein
MLQETLQVKLILENLILILHRLTLHVLIYIYKVIDMNHLKHVTSIDMK